MDCFEIKNLCNLFIFCNISFSFSKNRFKATKYRIHQRWHLEIVGLWLDGLCQEAHSGDGRIRDVRAHRDRDLHGPGGCAAAAVHREG